MERRDHAAFPRRLIGALAGAILALVTPAVAENQPAGKPFPADRTCSAIDSSFVSIAEETGGLVLPLSPAALAANTERVTMLLTARLVAVDLARGTLANGHRHIEAPVDAGVAKLVVTLCIDDEKEVTLVEPSGAARSEDDPSGFVLREGRHRIFYVAEPKPGAWALRVSGSGRYIAWVKVEGGANVTEADPYAVVEIPIVGQAYDWRFVISGKPLAPRLALVDGDGARIADSALARKDDAWVAKLVTPEKPFRFQVTGKDSFGTRFRRTLPRLVRPVSGNSAPGGGS